MPPVRRYCKAFKMRGSQILDMQVVAHSGAVRRGIVAAEHRHMGPLADHGLAGDFGEQGGPRSRLTNLPARVRARHVEITQRHVAHRIDRRHIAQHPLAHELGGAVGVDRLGGRFFAGIATLGHAIDGGSR